jgi:phenylacetic acid degradation operon negative regulatory protein
MQPQRNPPVSASASLRRGAAPLTARSIVASTLLGVRPPSLPPAALVRAGEIFGIVEGTTRVALSRMLTAGELEMDDGRYTLAGRLLDRMQRQDESRRPPLRRWDGTWRQAVVIAAGRTASERADLRAAMRELRFAEVREGVWVRPDNLATDDPAHARAIVDDQCMWMRAEVDDPRGLAAKLWDVDAWARRAEGLRNRIGASRCELDGPAPTAESLREGFVLAASVLRHMQADPLMPPELLPGDWPGRALRAEYADYARVFARLWSEWLRGAVHAVK